MLRRRIGGYACTTCIRSRIVRGGCHVLVCFACRASWSSLPGAACMCTSSPSRLLASYRIGDGPGRSRNLVGRQNIVHGARVCCMHALTYLHTSSAKASFFPPLRAFFFLGTRSFISTVYAGGRVLDAASQRSWCCPIACRFCSSFLLLFYYYAKKSG